MIKNNKQFVLGMCVGIALVGVVEIILKWIGLV